MAAHGFREPFKVMAQNPFGSTPGSTWMASTQTAPPQHTHAKNVVGADRGRGIPACE